MIEEGTSPTHRWWLQLDSERGKKYTEDGKMDGGWGQGKVMGWRMMAVRISFVNLYLGRGSAPSAGNTEVNDSLCVCVCVVGQTDIFSMQHDLKSCVHRTLMLFGGG